MFVVNKNSLKGNKTSEIMITKSHTDSEEEELKWSKDL